jgi:signal transduction histidine kinase
MDGGVTAAYWVRRTCSEVSDFAVASRIGLIEDVCRREQLSVKHSEIFTNLISNAVRFAHRGGQIREVQFRGFRTY